LLRARQTALINGERATAGADRDAARQQRDCGGDAAVVCERPEAERTCSDVRVRSGLRETTARTVVVKCPPPSTIVSDVNPPVEHMTSPPAPTRIVFVSVTFAFG
jgi:hypothetical protein